LKAVETFRGPVAVHLIDSQTTSTGLGLLVQAAAGAACQDASSSRINRLVRGQLSRVYTVFCIQSLTYLSHSGIIDPAQGLLGEMLSVTPFFVLENGRLTAVQKVRNQRHMVDLLQEFVSEFSSLKHVAIIQGVPAIDTHSLRDHISANYPGVSLSEHIVGSGLATILGPRCFGLIAMEKCNSE
jgi:DegV family protein with EDD domain